MRSLRSRMALTALLVSAAALLGVLLLVGPGLRREAEDSTRDRLTAEARLLARVVEEALSRGAAPAELDPLVDDAAKDVRARITLIAPDGRVLADSAVSGSELLALENHAHRPEVQQALVAGFGTAIRRSATVKDDLLYVAVTVRHEGKLAGIVRLALPLTGVEAQVSDLRQAVLAALLLAFLLTGALSALFTRPLAGPLREIMSAAREFASGNLAARMRVQRGDELGELAKILNQAADQLQQKLTENARDRARTDAILSAMEDGVLGVDHRGIVLLANGALRLNLDLRDPVGRHYLEVIRQKEVGEALERVLATGERQALEVEILKLRRVFALIGVPFPGAEGTPPGAVLTFHDATERQRLDRVRRDFVANASHELRTPLTSIRGFVEALEDGAMAEPERAERFLGKIHTHADRMAALVEDLLELSRLESGERPPRFEEVQPRELVEDVVASFSALAARRAVTLQGGEDQAPVVVTDADRLRRVLENLVDNAVKYTGAGGRVEVSVVPAPDGGALFQVKDNGPGIAREHVPRIFERFYRVDKARSRELGGTGLGLAIVRHLAEGMGAAVTVESEPNQGTSFRVSVPPGHEHPLAT
jgi:two-component system, OmpR family, phosphate regulon sensor histidine kinase PhoR